MEDVHQIILINPNCSYSIGLLSIGTYLRSLGYKIYLLDGDSDEIIRNAIALNISKPLFIGVSATTDAVEKAYEICHALKPRFPLTRFIIGGYHATAEPERTLNESQFDIAVVGEGELTVREVAQKLERGEFPTKCDGTFEKHDGKIIANPRRFLMKDLKEIPMYDFSLLRKPMIHYFCDAIKDNKGYSLTGGRGLFFLSSRGCPFDCVFCGSISIWQRKLRFYEIDIIIKQIENLINNFRMDSTTFLDDELVTNKAFFSAFCDALISKGISKKLMWECHARAKSITSETAKKLKEAGCLLVRMGIETGSEKTLHFLKGKQALLQDSWNAVSICKENGLRTFGSFIIGSPDENIDDLLQTINFIVKSGIDSVGVWVAVPYPGTQLYTICKERGFLREGITWKDYRVETNDKIPLPIIRSAHFTSQQLYDIAKYINSYIVKPLNWGFPIPKRNYSKDLEKVLKGNFNMNHGILRFIVYEKLMKIGRKLRRDIRGISENPAEIIDFVKRLPLKVSRLFSLLQNR